MPSARVLQIMLPSVFALAVAGVLSQYLAAIGLPRPLLAVWTGGAAFVLALSFALIPEHGAAGAAAASVAREHGDPGRRGRDRLRLPGRQAERAARAARPTSAPDRA